MISRGNITLERIIAEFSHSSDVLGRIMIVVMVVQVILMLVQIFVTVYPRVNKT